MKAKNVVLALAATGLISTQAYAADTRVEDAAKMAPQAAFSDADMQAVFQQTRAPMQLAALSQQEMKETEGAVLPAIVIAALTGAAGGAFGSALIHAAGNAIRGVPVSQEGLRIAAAAGAVTGAVGGPLIGAAGGGIAGNVAWRPAMIAVNNSIQRAANWWNDGR